MFREQYLDAVAECRHRAGEEDAVGLALRWRIRWGVEVTACVLSLV